MENVRAAIARVASIQATMSGRATSPPPSGRAMGRDGAQTVFADALARAGGYSTGTLGSMWGAPQPAIPGLTDTGLPLAAGATRSGPPPGFEAYSNGRLPLEMLAPIPGTDERMWAPAAQGFQLMRDAAARDGVALPVVDAYRPYEDQVRLANELGLYSQGGLAAEPGTSQHGWGRAVDLDLDDRALAWMRANAWKYGFKETVPREDWHWEFHPSY